MSILQPSQTPPIMGAIWAAHGELIERVIGRSDAADEIAVVMLQGGLFALRRRRLIGLA